MKMIDIIDNLSNFVATIVYLHGQMPSKKTKSLLVNIDTPMPKD